MMIFLHPLYLYYKNFFFKIHNQDIFLNDIKTK